jgi:hypothetical protein
LGNERIDFLRNLNGSIKICQATNQAESQSEAFSAVAVVFSKDSKALDKANHMLI